MRQAERSRLVDVGDFDAPVRAVAHCGHHLRRCLSYHDTDVLDAGCGDRLQAVEEDGFVGDRHQLLRLGVGDGSQPGPRSAREDQCLHRRGTLPGHPRPAWQARQVPSGSRLQRLPGTHVHDIARGDRHGLAAVYADLEPARVVNGNRLAIEWRNRPALRPSHDVQP